MNFSGRAARSEYWFWMLFAVLVLVAAIILDALFVGADSAIAPFSTIALLALGLPRLAVSVRRLHDTDRSGWWLLLFFIPIVGPIVLLVWYCTKGTTGTNRFGPDPLR